MTLPDEITAKYPDGPRRRWLATMTCYAPDNGELIVSGEGEYVGQAHEVTRHFLQHRFPGSITMLQLEALPADPTIPPPFLD